MSDPRPPKRKSARAAATESKIIAVVHEIINDVGLDGVKARIVAKAAGVSVGTLYNTFGPIEALVRLINADTYDSLYAHQMAALEAARAAEADGRAQLFALADSYLAWVQTHQKQWLATLSFNRSRPEPPPDWYREKETALLNIIAEALTGFETKLSDEDRQETAFALWASIHGIVGTVLGNGYWLQPEAQTRAQYAIIIHAVADRLERRPSATL